MSPVEETAWATLKVLQAVLLVRLAHARLLGRYCAFATYLFLAILSSAVLKFASNSSYSTYWSWITPALLMALTLAVIEVHWHIQACVRPLRHPNIATGLMIGVSAFVCWVTMEAHEWTAKIKAACLAMRWVAGTLAILMIWHAAWFPAISPPLRSSLLNHGRIMAVFLFWQACIFAAINLLSTKPPYAPRELLSVSNLLGQSACMVMWLIVLRRER